MIMRLQVRRLGMSGVPLEEVSGGDEHTTEEEADSPRRFLRPARPVAALRRAARAT